MSLADKFNIPKSLFETIVKMNKESADYQAKVKALMAKKGIRSLSDLSPEEKKDFFNTLDSMHKAKNEEVELDEAKKSVSKDDVTKLLIKYGNNPQSAKKMVDKEFDSAVKRHPEASASKIAEVIRSVAEEVELDEMDKSQPSSSRGAEGLPVGKKAEPVKTDKVKSDAVKVLQKQYKKEEVELDEEVAGWIAMYNGQKLEIKKTEAKDLYSAKLKAIAHFKVPKSKQGLLAIKPAYNEEVELDELSKDTLKSYQSKVQSDIIKQYNKGKDKKLLSRQIGLGKASQKIALGKYTKEEVELEEGKSGTGYDLYHKDFSSAMSHAYDFAKKKYDIEVDPSEIDRNVAMGPRKPSSGKANAYRLLDKTGKKAIQVQVTNLDNKRYELNMYKEDLDLDEAKSDEKVKVVGNDENGNFYINPITGKKVYQSGVKRGDRVNPKTGKVSNAFGASPADRLSMRGEEVEMKDFLVKFEKDGKVSAKNYTAKSELDAESKAKVDAKRMGMRVASVRLKEDFDISEAEGGGTTVNPAERAKATAERAKLTLQSAMLRMKQAKEREAIQKKKESIKEEVQAPFSGSKTVKPDEQKKDKYGNVIKNVAKHLAKKGMAQQSQKKEEVEEGKKFGYEKYQETSKKVTGKTPEERTKEIEDIQAKLKQQKAEFEARHSKKAMKEAYSLFMEAVKAKKEATAKDKEKSVKAGDKLSGKSEPIMIDPEVK